MNTLIKKILKYTRLLDLHANHSSILFVTFLVTSCLLAILLSRFEFWLILISFIFFHLYISNSLSTLVFNSRFFRSVASLLIFTIIFQVVIVLSWAINHEFPLTKTPYLIFILTILMVGIKRLLTSHRQQSVSPKRIIINKYDITALIVMFIISFIIIVPSISASGIEKRSSVIQLANANVDDASHISIFNDHLDFNRGILHHTKAASHLRSSTLYPASWHSLNVVGATSVLPHLEPGHQSLTVYIATKIFWFMVMIYMSLRVTLHLLVLFSKKEIPLLGLGTIGIIYLYLAQIFIHPFIEGFYSFLPQIIYASLLLVLVMQLPKKSPRIDANFAQYFSILTVVAVGSTLPWFLPLPIFLLFLISTLIYYFSSSNWQKNIILFLKNSAQYLHLYLLCGFAILLQYYVLATDESAGAVTLVEGLLLNGGITIYSLPFILLLILSVASFAIFTRSTQNKTHLDVIALFFSSGLFFITIVYFIQQAATGANSYYYYKLLYLMIATLTPFSLAGLYLLLKKVQEKQGVNILILGFAFVCLVINVIGIEPTTTQHSKYTYVSYFHGIRKITPLHNETIYKNLATVSTRENYFDNTYYFFYNLHTPQIDTTSFFLKSNKPGSNCFDRIRETFLKEEGIARTDEAAKRFCSNQKIYLIVSDSDKEEMKDLKLKKINFIRYDETIKIISSSDH